MKSIKYIFALILGLASVILVLSTESAFAASIVSDDFDAYINGSIVGQGGWNSYANGETFIIQGIAGAKALYNNKSSDNVIFKSGALLPDGNQTVYIRTENRSNWSAYANGNAQVGISKGSWGGREFRNFIAMSFKPDGNVAYYDSVSDTYRNFATYNDNEWTLAEFEWRSSDKKAHYRVNSGIWTDWYPFAGGGFFIDFDTVGFDFIAGGSGGFWIDNLSILSAPPTPTPFCTISSWQCGNWDSCTVNGSQTRTCNKIITCESGTPSPPTSQSCTPLQPTPVPTPTSSPTIIPTTTPSSTSAPISTPSSVPVTSPAPAPTPLPQFPVSNVTPVPTTNNQPTIQSLLEQIKILQSQISQLQSSQQKTSTTPKLLENTPDNTGIVIGSCAELTNNLTYRSRDISTNGEVSTLQDFLQINDYLNSEPTGFFGILTLEAVKKFQRVNNINPPAGFVGPITRAKIRTLSCQ